MRVLNIGCGPVGIPMMPHYDGWDVVRLDVEAENAPDLLMDAMDLDTLEAGQFDAAYASHLLEHVYPMDLARFLGGVRHVLTADGFAEFRVPDALRACRAAAKAGRLNAFCYQSAAGAIVAWDMLYGYLPYQERYGEPMAHHNAFSAVSLVATLRAHGFPLVYVSEGWWELRALACKTRLDAAMMERLRITDGATGERSLVHSDAGAADVDAIRQRRPVDELSLPTAPGDRGNGDTPAEAAADRRRAKLPRATVLGR